MIRIWKLHIVNAACITTLLLSLVFANASAVQATTNTAYTQPRWWSKYLNVSAPGFVPPKAGVTKSVAVGSNVDISNEPGPQSETSIAINPNNPSRRFVAGSNEIDRLPMHGYFSSDGGLTWGGVDLPLPPPLTPGGTDFGSDPGVAWDTQGNVYYAYIVVFFNGNFTGVTGTELAVGRSSDSGRTWTTSYFAFKNGTGQFNDKPMITVDTNPNSPFRDTIYVAWDTATGNSSSTNDVLVSHSTDNGRTFSDPVKASASVKGANAAIGADPFVGPDGTLFVAWNDIQHNAIVLSQFEQWRGDIFRRNANHLANAGQFRHCNSRNECATCIGLPGLRCRYQQWIKSRNAVLRVDGPDGRRTAQTFSSPVPRTAAHTGAHRCVWTMIRPVLLTTNSINGSLSIRSMAQSI